MVGGERGELGGVAEDRRALGGPLLVGEHQLALDGDPVAAGELLVGGAPLLARGQCPGRLGRAPLRQVPGVGQVGVDPGDGRSGRREGAFGAEPDGLVVGLVGAERDEDPGGGGEGAQEGVERVRSVALGDVRAVGVVDQDLLGAQQLAGAGVLGAADPVGLGGGGEAADAVPPGDGGAGRRGPAVDGDDGEGPGQGGQQPGEGERGVVEVRGDDEGAPGGGTGTVPPEGWGWSQGAGAGARGMSSGARAVSQAVSLPSQRPGWAATVDQVMPGGSAAESSGGVRRSQRRSKAWSG